MPTRQARAMEWKKTYRRMTPFSTMLVRGRGCHDDALGIDHLADHATRAVCRAHEGWAQTELFG